jgi:hypothetical protein
VWRGRKLVVFARSTCRLNIDSCHWTAVGVSVYGTEEAQLNSLAIAWSASSMLWLLS